MRSRLFFNDESVSTETCRANMLTLIEEMQIMVSSLGPEEIE